MFAHIFAIVKYLPTWTIYSMIQCAEMMKFTGTLYRTQFTGTLCTEHNLQEHCTEHNLQEHCTEHNFKSF